MKATESQTALSLEISENGSGIQVISHTEFPLADLPAIAASKPPSADFIDSVRSAGRILYPIVVIRVDGKLIIKDGLRRLATARILNLPSVPVLEVKLDSLRGSVLGLLLNQVRSENPIGELRMILELLKAGANEQAIAAATHMPLARIRQRLRLQELNQELFALADRGEIGVSLAQAAAKLSKAEQKTILRQHQKTGKVTLGDVHAVRQVGAAKIVAGLPDELFSDPKAAAPAWSANVRKLLNEARALVPTTTETTKLREAIEAGLAALA
jgi:ParB/RepB/Spo0J family partition protein